MAKYQCIRECRFKHRNYKVGQIVNVGKPEEELPQDKQGKLRHFVPVGQFNEDLVKETEIQDRLEIARNCAQIKAEKRDTDKDK
jgi:hypothetical protein